MKVTIFTKTSVGGEGAERACWAGFSSAMKMGHDEDLTGDVWLADYGAKKINVRDSSVPRFDVETDCFDIL